MTHTIGRTEHLSPIPEGAIRTLWHGRVDLQALEVGGKEVLLWKGKKVELPRHTGHSPRSFVNMSWFWTIPRLKGMLTSYAKPTCSECRGRGRVENPLGLLGTTTCMTCAGSGKPGRQ